MDEIPVGRVTHFFPAISVAAVALEDELRLGDTIRVAGHTSNFVQEVRSMQIDHLAVDSAAAGQVVAVETIDRARVNDLVFRTLPHHTVGAGGA